MIKLTKKIVSFKMITKTKSTLNSTTSLLKSNPNNSINSIRMITLTLPEPKAGIKRAP